MFAAFVPAVLSVLHMYQLRGGIEEIKQVSSVSAQARNVLEIIGHSLPSFTATALDLSDDERVDILDETDLQFKKLERAVRDLRTTAVAFVSKQQDDSLIEGINVIAHSWEEIREQSGVTMVAAEKTYHFLKIFAGIRTTHEILGSIEHDADEAAKEATALSFERIENATVLLICVLFGGALMGLLAISSNYQFAHTMRRSNERFDVALSNMFSGVCMFDGDQRLMVCNDLYASMYGLTTEQVKPGTTFRQILEYRISKDSFAGDSHEDYLQERLAAVMERNRSTKLQQLTDGRILEITHCPMPGNGWLATHYDVTERKKTEDELSQALEREKELNEQQRQFVSMASHEFRTPLAIIDSTAQRMKSCAEKDRLTPEDAVQRVEKIRLAVQRMTHLMESTLSAARMEDGKTVVEIGPCNIGGVIREVCARQQELAKDHVITYHLGSLPETIQADRTALEQVFTNLLSNAVKYAPGEPHIEVMGRVKKDHVVISISDYGLGIDEDDLSKMFGRFFRAKTSAGIAGTGIGLNLLKALVEMHNGSISVESKKGKGSSFTVRLPIAGPDRVDQANPKAA